MFNWLFNLFKPPQASPSAPPARPINVGVQGPNAAKLSLPQNLQSQAPPQAPVRAPAPSFIDTLGNYAKQYAQGVGGQLQQIVGRPADELIRSVLSFGSNALGGQQLNNPKPAGIESIIAGPQPINTIQTQTQQAKQALQQAGHPDIAKFTPFLAPILAGLDASGLNPVKSETKKAAENAIKATLDAEAKQSASMAVSAAKNAAGTTTDALGGRKPPVVPSIIPAADANKIKTTRFASKTVPESPYVGPEVSKIVQENAPSYIQ